MQAPINRHRPLQQGQEARTLRVIHCVRIFLTSQNKSPEISEDLRFASRHWSFLAIPFYVPHLATTYQHKSSPQTLPVHILPSARSAFPILFLSPTVSWQRKKNPPLGRRRSAHFPFSDHCGHCCAAVSRWAAPAYLLFQ